MILIRIELILLALPSLEDIDNICQQLKLAGYQGKLAAMARFEDERQQLVSLGIDKVFNFYSEVGVGFADQSLAILDEIERNNMLQKKSADLIEV